MLIDSHCHLFHDKYKKSSKEMVIEAADEGITKLICVGTSLSENLPVLNAIEEFPGVYGAIGIYPHDDMHKPLDELINNLEKQVTYSPKIVAIGECGIDITEWRGGRSLEEQLPLFEEQLKLAVKLNLPVVIHNRNGDDPVFQLVKKYVQTGLRGVIHCFVSDWDFAQKILDLGFFISFAGNITYPSNNALREIVQKVPVDRFLVETDSPYLPPQAHRGQVNEPKYVKIVAEKVAAIKNLSFEETSDLAYKNTCALFNIV